jgi:hypothetical protein
MKVYIDTEFNGFNGRLISMALVAEDGNEFYEVLECRNPVEWVQINVMPYLEKEPVEAHVFQTKLQQFLYQYESIELIADWPEDIKHFCNALITGPGLCLNYPQITMTMRRDLSSAGSKVPHNALHDARAIADEDLSKAYEQSSEAIIQEMVDDWKWDNN